MSTVFLVTMPRSGGAALAAMLGADASGCQATLVRTLGRGELEGKTWRLICSGQGNWASAVSEWSRLLSVVPDSRIVFLSRKHDPDGRYEISLTGTLGQWIPAYGECWGCVFNATKAQLANMEDFHVMNPGRTMLLDKSDLGDHAATVLKLRDLAPSRQAWDEQAAKRPNALSRMPKSSPPVMAPKGYDGDIPYGFFEKKLKDAMATGVYQGAGDVPEGFFEKKAKDAAAKDYDWEAAARGKVPASALRLPVPRTLSRTTKVEVHVLRYGDQPWLKECSDSLDRWADRMGWRVVEWGENLAYPHPKFCQVDMLRKFLEGDNEWIIYVDADVFVHPSAPEFPLKPGFSIMEDAPFVGGKVNVGWVNWCRERFPGLKLHGWRYRNAGVWSCDRASAEKMLGVIEEPYFDGPTMEQNHWNVWLFMASGRGMRIRDLPLPWNTFASKEVAAWFHHLAGRGDKMKKLRKLRKANLLPPAPEAFIESGPSSERAICYLWHAGQAVWEELRYSLRSVHMYFEPDVPIHIFATSRPPWLAEHPRITVHLTEGYPEALAAALQEAEEVVLMNDDICFLKPVGWDSLGTALTRGGDLIGRMRSHLKARNGWLRSVGRATLSLLHSGHDVLRDFSTHTPYLFERVKSVETMKRHGVWRKVPFETLYHNDHGTVSVPAGRLKTIRLPVKGYPAFLNYGAAGPDDQTKRSLMAMFKDPAPWERAPGAIAAVWTSVGGKLPHLEEFKACNPDAEVFVDEAPALAGPALTEAWRNGDRRILAWWEANRGKTDADRILFLEWDVRFAAPVDEVFSDPGDFLCAEVKYPGTRWQWWPETAKFPPALRGKATGSSPLSVLLLSRRALDAMLDFPGRKELMEEDIFCELRLATLATAAGYPPSAHPALSNVHYKECDPSRPIAHPVK